MASVYSRSQIVNEALSLAGRSTELKQSANLWLNFFLRHIGTTFRFPELRKIGSSQTLAVGVATSALPADFGAGMEKQGLIFGDGNKPLEEKSYEDFAANAGFPPNNTASGRPFYYIVDRNAGVFRFNAIASQAYSFFPVYFIQPPLLDISTSFDSNTIWLDNDLLAVEGLMWMIYKFTQDPREDGQEARVIRMINDWKRETVKIGGTSRILPSPARFKTFKFGGFGGFNGM